MSVPTRRILDPIFGEPVLRYQNNGMAGWCRENSVSQWQKGSGWTANLYGGVQSAWNDWAALFIPVNEMPLTELSSAMWTYYMTEAEAFGVNMVIWVHDPTDFNKRAEITQDGLATGLGKAAYWNRHILNVATDQFSFGGENTSASDLTEAPTSKYGLDDYQADAFFKNTTIYRISFEYGWHTGNNEFKDVWLADVKINNQRILLKPSAGDHIGGEVKTYAQNSNDSIVTRTLVTPATAKRIRVISINCFNTGTTATAVEVFFGTGTTIFTNPASALFETYLCYARDEVFPSDSIVFPSGSQPVGAIGEVVSTRFGSEISTAGGVTITYREE